MQQALQHCDWRISTPGVKPEGRIASDQTASCSADATQRESDTKCIATDFTREAFFHVDVSSCVRGLVS